MIEAAYTQRVLPVWTEDEAGPFQTAPYRGQHWQPAGEPMRHPHEYIREGTAKQLTLFHPASGQVRVKGVTCTTNLVLHGWLKQELSTIVATLSAPPALDPVMQRAMGRGVDGQAVPPSGLTTPAHGTDPG